MKVFHIIGSLEVGGAERVLESLVNYNNLKHIIFVIGRKKNDEILLKQNAEVSYLNFNLLNLIKLHKNISEFDPINFWHHNSFFLSLIFFFLKKKKIFWHIHNYKIDKKTFGYKNIIFFFNNILFSYFFPKKIIFCSQASLIFHKSYYFNKNNLILLENPIDDNRIKKKKILSNKVNKIKFIMCANFVPAKNFDQLFYLMSLIKNYEFSLDLFGRNISDNKILIKKIKKFDLLKKVTLNQFLDSSNILLNYDFSILTSHTESLPISILESMVAGTPPIASDVGDIRNLIRNNKFLIPKKIDKKTIYNINNLYIYRNSKEYVSRVVSDRKYVQKNYKIKNIYNKYLKIWKNLD